ncbi:sugar ABC transporter permease [Rhizobium sp. BK060]|uniref:carbohydrate ABC transporter permease n=1 Tax=Rhizobium sp. BK060 TaxID=2587096 RepID=UPI00160E2AFD|nr:sugar ABC transporter permease [Rhizobium sp. BK060]MBB3396197.1 multiple sugar transport system permease protein [Rhizobium sp. BK060]
MAKAGSIAMPPSALSATKAVRAGEKNVPRLLLAPTLIIMNVVGLYPLLHSLYISLTNYNPTFGTSYSLIGFGNYARAFSDGQFWHSVGLTLLFTAISVTASLTLAVLLALLFNRNRPGFLFLRTFLLIPMLITPIAVGIVWRTMMMPDLGILNYLLSLIGFPGLAWAGSPSGALASVILVDVWQWTPFMFIIIFAGLRSLPRSPFEAAQIDGAGHVSTFLNVTLPMLKPVIVIATLLRIVDAFRTYDTVYIITRGGPDFATDLLSVYLQRVNFRIFDLGYGSALSWIALVIILLIVIVFVNVTGFLKLVADKESR